MKKTILTLLITILCLNFISACSDHYSNEDTIKEFLSTFYEVPDPTIAIENIASVDSLKEDQYHNTFFHKKFKKYFTEDAYLTFMVYPNWMHGYVIAATNGLKRIANDISIEKKNDEDYVFSLNVSETNTKTGESIVIVQKGNITMKNNKISDISFEDISSLFPSRFKNGLNE